MARDKVQFQKGLSEAEFQKLYGAEELCRAVIFKLRWPDGFVCPACQGRAHCVLTKRILYQCNACKLQTSLTAGTIFAATKLELTVWFRAMYHMTQSKQGISSPAPDAHEPACAGFGPPGRANWAAGWACASASPGP